MDYKSINGYADALKWMTEEVEPALESSPRIMIIDNGGILQRRAITKAAKVRGLEIEFHGSTQIVITKHKP